MRDFWQNEAHIGLHPHDVQALDQENVLDWDLNEAHLHPDFDNEEELHRLLHIGLYPQPFIGNVETASVYFLFGNPGLAISDYDDELNNPPHAELCAQNLLNNANGFFPLLAQADNTGVANYWRPRLGGLIAELANRQQIDDHAAAEIIRHGLCLIESSAYHSKSTPGQWIYQLPSSIAAHEFLHEELLPRAAAGDALLFVWRSAAFWAIPDGAVGVLQRPPAQAQLAYLNAAEKGHILDFLCGEGV